MCHPASPPQGQGPHQHCIGIFKFCHMKVSPTAPPPHHPTVSQDQHSRKGKTFDTIIGHGLGMKDASTDHVDLCGVRIYACRSVVSPFCDLPEPRFPASKMHPKMARVVGSPHEILYIESTACSWCLQPVVVRFLLKGPGPPTRGHEVIEPLNVQAERNCEASEDSCLPAPCQVTRDPQAGRRIRSMSLVSQGIAERTGLRTQVSRLGTPGKNGPCTICPRKVSCSEHWPEAATCQIPEWRGSRPLPLEPLTWEKRGLELGGLRFESQLCHLASV